MAKSGEAELDVYPEPEPAMVPKGVRLRIGATLWRLILILFVFWEVFVFYEVLRRGGRLVAALVFVIVYIPTGILAAFLLGLTITVVLALAVRYLASPMIRLWHRPMCPPLEELTMLHFHVRESILDHEPVRMSHSHRAGWMSGRLVITNERLLFFPRTWTEEPWTTNLGEIVGLELSPGRSFLGDLTRGIPPHVTIRLKSGDGTQFAIWQHEKLLQWLPKQPLTWVERTPASASQRRRSYFVDREPWNVDR